MPKQHAEYNNAKTEKVSTFYTKLKETAVSSTGVFDSASAGAFIADAQSLSASITGVEVPEDLQILLMSRVMGVPASLAPFWTGRPSTRQNTASNRPPTCCNGLFTKPMQHRKALAPSTSSTRRLIWRTTPYLCNKIAQSSRLLPPWQKLFPWRTICRLTLARMKRRW